MIWAIIPDERQGAWLASTARIFPGRALVLGDGEMIRPEDLVDELLEHASAEVPLSDYQATITETKRRLLAEADGNSAEAGQRLGLHPNSFRRLRRQLGSRYGGEG